MTFQKGQSGNPAGRPLSRPDRRSQYRELFESHAPDLINKAIEMALDGDTQAMKLCMERIMPKLTGHHVKLDLPDSNLATPDYLLGLGINVINQTATGKITPEQARSLATVLESQRKAAETVELRTLLDELKERLNDK